MLEASRDFHSDLLPEMVSKEDVVEVSCVVQNGTMEERAPEKDPLEALRAFHSDSLKGQRQRIMKSSLRL